MTGGDLGLTFGIRGLPLAWVGEGERRKAAVFAVGGGVLALTGATELEASAGQDGARLALFSAFLAPGTDQFGAARVLAVDLATTAPLSEDVAPILLSGSQGAADFTVAWALDGSGILRATPLGASVLDGLPEGQITALCGQGMQVFAGVQGPDGARVFACDLESAAAGWQELAAGPLDLATGSRLNALSVFDGHLYAAMANERAGFELWRCPLDRADAVWSALIARGAWRHGYNRAVSAMAQVDGRLYVAVDGPDLTQVYLGDEHPELIAVARDGTWEMISGQGRFTPDGLVQPTTGQGPGTPECSGLTIAALQGFGAGVEVELDLWLVPRRAGPGGDAEGLVTRWHWSGRDQIWSVPEAFALPRMALNGLARSPDGRVVVTASGPVAGGPARQPLVIGLAPR